jgi:8-oxo-dGTP pyrophosphatase MutT (NUDIX family)
MSKLRNDFTATGVILNDLRDRVLLIFHKKLGKWLPPGGHVDPQEMPHDAALREVFEETGVVATIVDTSVALNISPANTSEYQMPTPFCILHERIPASAKDVEHMHFDFIYLLQASEGEINKAEREITDARWFSLTEVISLDTTEGTINICKAVMN